MTVTFKIRINNFAQPQRIPVLKTSSFKTADVLKFYQKKQEVFTIPSAIDTTYLPYDQLLTTKTKFSTLS